MGVKNGGDLLGDDMPDNINENDKSEENVLEKSFGMMAISETGEMRFLGTAANESLLMASPSSSLSHLLI